MSIMLACTEEEITKEELNRTTDIYDRFEDLDEGPGTGSTGSGTGTPDNEWPNPISNLDLIFPQYDASGEIEMKLFTRASSGTKRTNWRVSATVDDDYVLVGGGAWIEKADGAGAILTASLPVSSNTWWASSKDHGVVDEHKLHVYAIGMKIKGFSSQELSQYITMETNDTSTPAQKPEVSVTLDDSYHLIGGGAEILWKGPDGNQNNAGNLLTDSYPEDNTWYAAGTDLHYVSPSTIRVAAIGIKKTIPGFGEFDVGSPSGAAYEGEISGIKIAKVSLLSEGTLITCQGAKQDNAWGFRGGVGRVLSGMKPSKDLRTVSVRSKDHLNSSYGFLYAKAISIKKAE